MTVSLAAPKELSETPLVVEVLCTADNLSCSRNVAVSVYGPGMMSTAAAGQEPSVLEWSVTSEGGRRDIWVLYAAEESRAVRLSVNRQPVTGKALVETTGGWWPQHLIWLFQHAANFAAGANHVELRCESVIPHIQAVAVCRPNRLEETSVDDRADILQRLMARQLPQCNVEIEDLHRHLAKLRDAYFAVRTRGVPHDAIVLLFRQYLDAPQIIADCSHDFLNTFGGPFNGQNFRHRIVMNCIKIIDFSAFVETGSYLGTTTEYFARLGFQVFSCEINLRNFLISSYRLAAYPNVKLLHQDSRAFLAQSAAKYPSEFARPLVYLDAHWLDDLPLAEELNFIFSHCADFLVVIDDFQVPGSAYGFDRYANGNELTMEFIVPKLELSTKPVFLVPTRAATEETGAQRGTLFVTSRCLYEEKIRHLPMLKRLDEMQYLS